MAEGPRARPAEYYPEDSDNDIRSQAHWKVEESRLTSGELEKGESSCTFDSCVVLRSIRPSWRPGHHTDGSAGVLLANPQLGEIGCSSNKIQVTPARVSNDRLSAKE